MLGSEVSGSRFLETSRSAQPTWSAAVRSRFHRMVRREFGVAIGEGNALTAIGPPRLGEKTYAQDETP